MPRRTLYLLPTYRCPAADFSATKGKKKGVHQRELWCTPFINVSDAAMLRRRILRNQYLLSVDEVDALRQSNEARALHVTIEETDT